MKRVIAAAAIALSLCAGSVAMADSWNNHRGGNDHSQDRGHDDHRNDGGRNDHGRNDWRGNDHRSDHGRNDWRGNDHRFDHGRNDWRRDDHRFDHRYDHRFDGPRYDHRYYPGRYRAGPYYRPYGYSARYWHRGDRLPAAYYGPRYIVDDYYSYGLRSPPRGCHWVRVNNDVVLAAITTGIVLDIAYNHFY
jgi:Ni/Co efflux regulator RcnB